jgi:hypothetical protein
MIPYGEQLLSMIRNDAPATRIKEFLKRINENEVIPTLNWKSPGAVINFY